MAINQHFRLYKQDTEKALVDDLMEEGIQIYGFSMFYIPRTHIALNSILGEDPISKFETAYEVEMYVKSTESFGNNQDFLSMGGLEIRDSAKLQVSRKTFGERLYGSDRLRPREGDLIYFPLGNHNNLFEVRFVEDEDPFYQLGGLYVWTISVDMFEYSNELLRTGIPEIDSIENRYAASVDVTIGAGSGNYAAKEIVYQGANLGAATFQAEVISWASPILKIKHTRGSIQNATVLKGNTSSASRTVTSSSLDSAQGSTNDPFQDNSEFQEKGDEIIDFNPKNPFGGE